MRRFRYGLVPIFALAALLLLRAAVNQELLWRYRNLGKAFYENPATQLQAVDEFRKALELQPNSARERLNYGLALLRAGKTREGTAELEQVQKQDPSIPHTWFNLGLVYKRAGDYQRAIDQFQHMIKLVPNEPVSHYNLGVLYKVLRQQDTAIGYFQQASRLDPNLAAPHFQLFNAYRQAGKKEDAARELAVFQQIKKRQEGAAVPEDMEWSYYAEIYDTIPARPADSPPAEVRFETRRLEGRADPASAGLAVLDADGDGRPDLLAWSRSGVLLYRNGLEPVADLGLASLKDVLSVAPGDFNNDGLPDLCVLTARGPLLFVNQNGRFVKKEASLPQGRFDKAVWLDYDHDYDIDLLLLGEKSVLLRNQGGEFADRTADFPFVNGRVTGAVVYRVVADSKAMDLAVSYADRPGVIYRDRLAGHYEATPGVPAGASRLRAFDMDNDGQIELVYAGPGSPIRVEGAAVFADLENRGFADLVAGNSVLRNLGQRRTAPEKTPAGFVNGVAWATADFDLDGRPDLAAINSDGGIYRLLNRTATGHQWLGVRLDGIKNPKLAPGAEVEVKTGALYQKRIYDGVPLVFGLAGEKTADTVRITWPNGLIQNETEQAAGRTFLYEEAQRLSGSCPTIFTWNGHRFSFLTDVLGVAPLGASAGEGQYFPVDHDEYVSIPGERMQPRNGHYEIRITEELREVSYLDRIRLIALDHPSAVEVFTNEKFKSPPFPEFRLFGVTQRVYPVSARDDAGRDVREALLHRDCIYPDRFARDYSGVAARHSLDLDFGRAAPGNRAVLVLNGWVDWADGSTFRAASQQGAGLIMPYLQVKDAAGRWRTVVEDMGIPAGKPKTIVVDLGGKFLSSSREVRIVTNLCVYWDEIFLAENAAAPPARLTPLDAIAADLRFRGFSRAVIDQRRKQPEWFDYAQVSPVSMWNPTSGLLTRYGEVAPLLKAADDRFVIMGSGDELQLMFDPSGLPALTPGWRRDFLLYVDGWAKDGDLNTAGSQTVEPLPFHAMSRYPYSNRERYPNDAAHAAWRATYNTRPALRLIRPLVR